MRRFLHFLLPALVLAAVFLASAMTTMRLAIHGRESATPKLVGMTANEADRAAGAAGLVLEIESRFYSPDVPEGRVMSQAPAPPTDVKRGSKIRVALSLGPQRVTIPAVVGQSPRAVELNLGRRGLQVGTMATLRVSGLPPDQVIAQSPPANAQGIESPKVNLLVTAPAEEGAWFVMPNFVGRSYGEAHSAIIEAGFKLAEATVLPRADGNGSTPAPVPTPASKIKAISTDTVIRQSPAPGQKIAAGTTIHLEVAR